jgi:hypothetical protein
MHFIWVLLVTFLTELLIAYFGFGDSSGAGPLRLCNDAARGIVNLRRPGTFVTEESAVSR